jgi:A/G-specific adenine glycosylase
VIAFATCCKTENPDLNHPLDAQAVLDWFDQHGRHDLPWQQHPTPYRVWVSEIMLQQTQVNTVIAYYQRFMHRFPDVHTLAVASQDEVLHLWTGLGYYARARNLHKSAQLVTDHHNGLFPKTLDELMSLPGIGRSTAGAILALAMGQRGVILDGNVKRVLCRYHAINTWAGESRTLAHLWELADAATPAHRIADYTQAMMDLGATVCTRGKPACSRCPLQANCLAHQQQLTSLIPVSKPRKVLPQRSVVLLLCQLDNRVLLQQRQNSGLWGGLWSLPEYPTHDALQHWLQQQGLPADSGATPAPGANNSPEIWPVLRHTFSHFHLDITPVVVRVDKATRLMDSAGTLWYPLDHSLSVGLSAPVKKLLDRLSGTSPQTGNSPKKSTSP